jgi:hypothetical protein
VSRLVRTASVPEYYHTEYLVALQLPPTKQGVFSRRPSVCRYEAAKSTVPKFAARPFSNFRVGGLHGILPHPHVGIVFAGLVSPFFWVARFAGKLLDIGLQKYGLPGIKNRPETAIRCEASNSFNSKNCSEM